MEEKYNISEVKKLFNNSPFYKFLGMKITNLKSGYAELTLPFKKQLKHAFKDVHGGVTASIADAAVGAALLTLLKRDEKPLTVELKIAYCAPAMKSELIATAEILPPTNKSPTRTGRFTVRRTDGEKIAFGIGIFFPKKQKTENR